MGVMSAKTLRAKFLILMAAVCLTIINFCIPITYHHENRPYEHQNENRETLYASLRRLQIEIHETFRKFEEKERFINEKAFNPAVWKEENWKREEGYQTRKRSLLRFKPDCKHPPFLLIQVHSTPENVMAREAIRMSWGRPDNNINKDGVMKEKVPGMWKTVFLLGQTFNPELDNLLHDEARKNGDMAFGDFIDSYRNLTSKMVFGIKWATKHCQAEYVMKADDDSFINIHGLVLWLNEHHERSKSHSKPLYMGAALINTEPIRDSSSPFYVSKREYPFPIYPPYAPGAGYVFSGDLLVNLSMVMKYVKLFPNEDACFGVLMKFLKVELTYNERFLPFTMGKATYWQYQGYSICKFIHPLVIHRISGKLQIQTHFNVLVLQHTQTICQHIKSGIDEPEFEVSNGR